jgi:3-methyladenine DNA glycosylase AlkD
MLAKLEEIRKILKEKSNEKVKISILKFIPTSQKVYGVKVSELNKLATKYKNCGFEIVEELWKSGSLEEKILASKILGKICKKDSEKTLKFLEKFSKEIYDWATCDTLATQAIKGIAKLKQKKIFKISRKLIKSKNFWERRFAIVLLTNFVGSKNLRKEIGKIVKNVENDKEYYVKKAVEWIKRRLNDIFS